jgi:uncharacterized membrane protein (GlpM family)
VIDLLWRFLIGGLVVSLFAVLGDLLNPKSFSGLLGAAPSVALATLALTIRKYGAAYAAIECRSMFIGAIALGVCTFLACRLLMARRAGPRAAALIGVVAWFVTALSLCMMFLRPRG